MWVRYLLRRLITSVGVLLGVLLLTYGLSRLSDADPVYAYLEAQNEFGNSTRSAGDTRAYSRAARRLGLDLPGFFFALSPKHYPDTLHRILPLARRQQAETLLREGLPWPHIQTYQTTAWSAGSLSPDAQLEEAHHQGQLLVPTLRWYGSDNGFVYFMKGLLRGDLGYSSRTGNPVASSLLRALVVTLPIALVSLLLAVVLGILLGLPLARHRWRALRLGLYAFVSAPGFWLATIFVTQLSGRGKPFPGPGWRGATDSLANWLSHTTLPISILALPAAAYLALLLEEAIRREDRLPLRDFARMQGASERSVWWREMLRLGIAPSLATAVGLLIPAFLGGSVVVEYVFNIPGLGRLVFESILARDWPVVLGVVLLSGLATIIGYVVMDVVNAWIDPRFRKFVVHAN